MKIKLFGLLFMLLNLNIQVQNKEALKNSESTIYKLFKSINEKPEYHYSVGPYTPSHYFFIFNFDENKKTALLDSLKQNTKLDFIKTKKDKRLRLRITFPKMDHNTFITLGETKLSLIEAHVFSSNNKELELTDAFDYSRNNIRADKQNNIILCLNKEMTLVDSTTNIKNCHGSVRYEISFVVGYDSLRLDRSSISKTVQFGDNKLKVIDIIENKVILQVIHSKTSLISLQLKLLNFDSLNNVLSIDYKYYSKQSALNQLQQINSAVQRPIVEYIFPIPKVAYDIFKENPDMSYEDYKKAFTLQQESKHDNTSYLVYCSFAPLKNSFMLYKPIYGRGQIVQTELNN